jgi:hypothetical protein
MSPSFLRVIVAEQTDCDYIGTAIQLVGDQPPQFADLDVSQCDLSSMGVRRLLQS